MEKQSLIAREQFGLFGVKVLSDIEDTIRASFGGPHGVDQWYPRHSFYPGALKLCQFLDTTWQPDVPSCNLVFLSSRFRLYKERIEEVDLQPLIPLYKTEALHSFPTLLQGRFRTSLLGKMLQYVNATFIHRRLADDRRHMCINYRRLYQEYDFIFMGDDGQGDLLAAQETVREEAQGVSQWRCALIHKVAAKRRRPRRPLVIPEEADADLGSAWESTWRSQGLIYHDTYIGAAVDLHVHAPELMPLEAVAVVTESAVEDFNTTRATSFDWTEKMWESASAEIQRDVVRANELLRAAGKEEVTPPQTYGSFEDMSVERHVRKYANNSSNRVRSTNVPVETFTERLLPR